MPRMRRAVLPDYPHHIIQRGHNRQVIFAEAGDFERYLETLANFKDIYGVKVYAWCLMTNHVHLLVAPEDMTGLGQLMKRLAGRQTRDHNRLERRTGTLWESRYKSSPVDSATASYFVQPSPKANGVSSERRFSAANSPVLTASWRRSKRSSARGSKIDLAADHRRSPQCSMSR